MILKRSKSEVWFLAMLLSLLSTQVTLCKGLSIQNWQGPFSIIPRVKDMLCTEILLWDPVGCMLPWLQQSAFLKNLSLDKGEFVVSWNEWGFPKWMKRRVVHGDIWGSTITGRSWGNCVQRHVVVERLAQYCVNSWKLLRVLRWEFSTSGKTIPVRYPGCCLRCYP